MTVGLVLVTHGDIGCALLHQARQILDDPLEGVASLAIDINDRSTGNNLGEAIAAAEQGAAVLVMTDLPGASPSNLAVEVGRQSGCSVIAGLNLPMLIRAWNYRNRPIDELKALAIEGGKQGVLELL